MPDVNDLFEQEYLSQHNRPRRHQMETIPAIDDVDIVDEETPDDSSWEAPMGPRPRRGEQTFALDMPAGVPLTPQRPLLPTTSLTETEFAHRERRRKNLKGWLVAATIVGALNLGLRCYSCVSAREKESSAPQSPTAASAVQQEHLPATTTQERAFIDRTLPTVLPAHMTSSPVTDNVPFEVTNVALLYTAVPATYLLLIDKQENRTRLYGRHGALLIDVRSTEGVEPGQKQNATDDRTPEGIYTIKSVVLHEALIGFELNAPNLFDREEGMTASSVALKGLPTESLQYLDADCSRGDVFFENTDMKRIHEQIASDLFHTYVAIVSSSNTLASLLRTYSEKARRYTAKDGSLASLEQMLACSCSE